MSVDVTMNTLNAAGFQGIVKDKIKEACEFAVNRLQASSPKRTGGYATGWTYIIVENTGVVYNNGKHRSLTHLLELGHRSRNGGSVAPQEHIRPVYLETKDLYLKSISDIDITEIIE